MGRTAETSVPMDSPAAIVTETPNLVRRSCPSGKTDRIVATSARTASASHNQGASEMKIRNPDPR